MIGMQVNDIILTMKRRMMSFPPLVLLSLGIVIMYSMTQTNSIENEQN